MSQKNFVVPESKKVLLKNSTEKEGKKKKKPTKTHSDWRHVKEIQTPTEREPMAKAGNI